MIVDFSLEFGKLLLLRVTESSEFLDTVVVLIFVLRNDKSAAVLARKRSLRIVLALFEVGLQGVEFQNGVTSVDLIVAGDVQTTQQISQDARNRSEIGIRYRLSIYRASSSRLPTQPFLDAASAKSVLAVDYLEWLFQHRSTY